MHVHPELTLPNQQHVAIILHAQWLANILLTFIQTSPLPPEVTAHDRTFRHLMMATGFWPSNLDINGDLNQLLVILLDTYNALLERTSLNN